MTKAIQGKSAAGNGMIGLGLNMEFVRHTEKSLASGIGSAALKCKMTTNQ
jgi:hypothetical protein